MPVWILIVGVMIGGTAAGLVAHAMHYFADAPRAVELFFLGLYVIALTIGVSLTYGNTVAVALSGFLSIFVISKGLFSVIEPHLPEPASTEYDLPVDDSTDGQDGDEQDDDEFL